MVAWRGVVWLGMGGGGLGFWCTLTGGRNIANCTKGGMEGGSPDLLSSLGSLKEGQYQMDMRINVPPQHNIAYIT